jgi:hypothetical protein
MSAKKRDRTGCGEVSQAEFSALRDFLRGYLHEDAMAEYGSPEVAARQFCCDSDAEQRKVVAAEWRGLMRRMEGKSLEDINRLLTTKLGSALTLSQAQLAALSEIFEKNCS